MGKRLLLSRPLGSRLNLQHLRDVICMTCGFLIGLPMIALESAVRHEHLNRPPKLSIPRISWIEVLAGVRDAEDQNRVENLLGFFEMIELNDGVARETIALRG